VGEGLALLQNHGFRLVIATNQQGIGLGYYSEDDFIRVNQALFRLLAPFRVSIDRVVFCPHSLADNCECRKPGALLLRRTIEYYNASPSECYMIGDRVSDLEAGEKAGCKSILLSGAESPEQSFACTNSFLDAVKVILAETKHI
jgi:D-glycero-D-manno-heptose 1,7-bisphosphate phosphatase